MLVCWLGAASRCTGVGAHGVGVLLQLSRWSFSSYLPSSSPGGLVRSIDATVNAYDDHMGGFFESSDELRDAADADTDALHALLITLWSKAVAQHGYTKKEWVALQQAIFSLQLMTPPDPIEPQPWNGNGC